MKKDKLKVFAGDLIYSLIGLLVFNGVMQLLIYPRMTVFMGSESWGVVLTIISAASIVATSFGTGANYSRMVVSVNQDDVAGDYNIFLAWVAAGSLAVSFFTMFIVNDVGLSAYIGIYCLMVAMTLRYFSDVEYRLNVNYRGLMVYYFIITAGYIAGLALYPVFHSWALTLVLGELLGPLWVAVRGHIYRRPLFRKSPHFKENIRSMLTLSSSYLLTNLVLFSDRILLLIFEGGTAVTVFYTATLVGKIVSLLTSPLNGVITGHLAKYKGKITRKAIGELAIVLIGIGIVVTAASMLVSVVFVKLMYADLYDQASQYFLVANAGQIVYFISETFLVVLLRYTKENLQLKINSIYAILFYAVGIPAVMFFGTMGLGISILVVNIIRFAAVVAIGIHFAEK
jgi:O-antigen/teichoic acid export membrane protein